MSRRKKKRGIVLSPMAKYRRAQAVMRTPRCVECGAAAKYGTGAEAGLNDPHAARRMVWYCECGAWCGCHPGTSLARGNPGSPDTLAARRLAHLAFDPIWQDSRSLTRREAYAWLADQLGLSVADCHIGLFNAAMCERVVEVCEVRRRGAA